MGRADVEKHIAKPMHQANDKSRKAQSTLQFIISQESPTAEKVYLY